MLDSRDRNDRYAGQQDRERQSNQRYLLHGPSLLLIPSTPSGLAAPPARDENGRIQTRLAPAEDDDE
ncbi:MAG TPA: hypothetical protein VGO93_07335 [Candidatus Xenobia bacterium]